MLREFNIHCPLCKTGFESYIDVELVKYDGCNITCPKCSGFLTILRGRIVSEAQARDEEHEIKMQEIQKHLESLTANDKRYRFLRDNKFLDNICPNKAQDPRSIDLHIDVAIKEKQNNDKSVFRSVKEIMMVEQSDDKFVLDMLKLIPTVPETKLSKPADKQDSKPPSKEKK